MPCANHTIAPKSPSLSAHPEPALEEERNTYMTDESGPDFGPETETANESE